MDVDPAFRQITANAKWRAGSFPTRHSPLATRSALGKA
jgi:hypothetical protein